MVLQSRRLLAGAVLALAAAAVSAVAAPSLPEQVVTRWDAAGTPDGTMSKTALLLGGPLLVGGLVVLFEVIPRVDPLAENIAAFRDAYDAGAVLIAAFVAYVHGVVVAWNLGYQVAVGQALAPAIAVLYVGVGFLLERAERNWFVGIRTPWTLSSDAVWRRTHDRAATLFKVAGVLALGALLFPAQFVYFAAVPAAAAALFATVYSYLAYRRVGNGEADV